MSKKSDPAARSIATNLALVYAALVIYLSLSPFQDWQWPESVFSYLWAPWPPYWTDFDLFINVLAYVPLGFLVSVALSKQLRRGGALVLTTALCALLSLTLETLQGFLPFFRYASNVDVGCNVLGALLGAALASWLAQYTTLEANFVAFRHWLFQPGAIVDRGAVIVLLWLLAQTNPSIPFLGAGLINSDAAPVELTQMRVPWPQISSVALNFCGIGLLLSVLIQGQVKGLLAALLLMSIAFVLKSLAAVVMLKPAAAFDWLETGTTIGMAAGIFLLLLSARLAFGWRAFFAATFVVAGALLAKLFGHYAGVGDVLGVFSWRYGQLLNYTGLTYYLNEFWPVIALVFLVFYYRSVQTQRV